MMSTCEADVLADAMAAACVKEASRGNEGELAELVERESQAGPLPPGEEMGGAGDDAMGAGPSGESIAAGGEGEGGGEVADAEEDAASGSAAAADDDDDDADSDADAAVDTVDEAPPTRTASGGFKSDPDVFDRLGYGSEGDGDNRGRGLHSFTSQLNLRALYGIGGVREGLCSPC